MFAHRQFVEYLVVKEKCNRYENIMIKEKENKCTKAIVNQIGEIKNINQCSEIKKKWFSQDTLMIKIINLKQIRKGIFNYYFRFLTLQESWGGQCYAQKN